jgi:hypothetical protein
MRFLDRKGQSFQFGGQHDDGSVERIPSLLLSPELWNADFLGVDVLVLARWHLPITSKVVQAFRRAIRFKPPSNDEHLQNRHHHVHSYALIGSMPDEVLRQGSLGGKGSSLTFVKGV